MNENNSDEIKNVNMTEPDRSETSDPAQPRWYQTEKAIILFSALIIAFFNTIAEIFLSNIYPANPFAVIVAIVIINIGVISALLIVYFKARNLAHFVQAYIIGTGLYMVTSGFQSYHLGDAIQLIMPEFLILMLLTLVIYFVRTVIIFTKKAKKEHNTDQPEIADTATEEMTAENPQNFSPSMVIFTGVVIIAAFSGLASGFIHMVDYNMLTVFAAMLIMNTGVVAVLIGAYHFTKKLEYFVIAYILGTFVALIFSSCMCDMSARFSAFVVTEFVLIICTVLALYLLRLRKNKSEKQQQEIN